MSSEGYYSNNFVKKVLVCYVNCFHNVLKIYLEIHIKLY